MNWLTSGNSCSISFRVLCFTYFCTYTQQATLVFYVVWMKGSTFYEEDYESFFWTASWWNSSDKYTRMTKTVKYHIRQSFPYSVALFIVNGSPADIAFWLNEGFLCFWLGKTQIQTIYDDKIRIPSFHKKYSPAINRTVS